MYRKLNNDHVQVFFALSNCFAFADKNSASARVFSRSVLPLIIEISWTLFNLVIEYTYLIEPSFDPRYLTRFWSWRHLYLSALYVSGVSSTATSELAAGPAWASTWSADKMDAAASPSCIIFFGMKTLKWYLTNTIPQFLTIIWIWFLSLWIFTKHPHRHMPIVLAYFHKTISSIFVLLIFISLAQAHYSRIGLQRSYRTRLSDNANRNFPLSLLLRYVAGIMTQIIQRTCYWCFWLRLAVNVILHPV